MLLVNRISPLSSEPIKIRDYSCVINTNVDKVLDSRISNIEQGIMSVEVFTQKSGPICFCWNSLPTQKEGVWIRLLSAVIQYFLILSSIIRTRGSLKIGFSPVFIAVFKKEQKDSPKHSGNSYKD